MEFIAFLTNAETIILEPWFAWTAASVDALSASYIAETDVEDRRLILTLAILQNLSFSTLILISDSVILSRFRGASPTIAASYLCIALTFDSGSIFRSPAYSENADNYYHDHKDYYRKYHSSLRRLLLSRILQVVDVNCSLGLVH
jgi:hypothetical protein